MVTSSALLATGALESELLLRISMMLMHRVMDKTKRHTVQFNEEHYNNDQKFSIMENSHGISRELDEKAWREIAQALHYFMLFMQQRLKYKMHTN